MNGNESVTKEQSNESADIKAVISDKHTDDIKAGGEHHDVTAKVDSTIASTSVNESKAETKNHLHKEITPPRYIIPAIAQTAPLLIGKYTIEADHIFIDGMWGMNATAFQKEEDGLTSKFEMKSPLTSCKSMPALPEIHPACGGNVLQYDSSTEAKFEGSQMKSPVFCGFTPTTIKNGPVNGVFDGFFQIQSLKGKPQNVNEKDVHIYFFYDRENPSCYRVEGYGQNKFGHFKLQGHYAIETSQIFLYKVYMPKAPKTKTATSKTPVRKRNSRKSLTAISRPSTATTPATTVAISSSAKSKTSVKAASTESKSSIAPHVTDSAAVTSAAEVATPRFRSERKRVIPAHLREDSRMDSDSTKVPMRLRRCWNALKALMSSQMAVPFLEPVDPVRLNIPDYLTVVKNPMDLGTVKHMIERGDYETPIEFAEHVRLVFKNAMLYNKPDHLVYVWAQKLMEQFDKKFHSIEKEYKKKILSNRHSPDSSSVHNIDNSMMMNYSDAQDYITGASSSSTKRKPSKRKSTSNSKNSEIEMMKQQIEQMKQQIQLMHQSGTGSTPKGSAAGTPQHGNSLPAGWDVNRAMTFEEKRELSQNINLLPQDKLGKVLEIIHERVPFRNGPDGDGEIEIDINSFDTQTLRILQQYVVNALSTTKRKRAPQRSFSKRASSSSTITNHLELAESVGRATSDQIRTIESQLKQLQDSPTISSLNKKSTLKKSKLTKSRSLVAAEEASSSDSGSSSESSSNSDDSDDDSDDEDDSDDGLNLQKV